MTNDQAQADLIAQDYANALQCMNDITLAIHAQDHELMRSLAEELLAMPLVFKTHCTKCGGEAFHHAPQVALSPYHINVPGAEIGKKGRKDLPRIPRQIKCPKDWDGVTIIRELVCPRCKEVDAYELDESTQYYAQYLRFATQLLWGLTPPPPPICPVSTYVATLYDGTVLTRLSHGVAYLRGRFKADPENGAIPRHIGNLYQKARDSEQATKWFRTAIEVDPLEAEAPLTLSEMAIAEGDDRGALHWASETLRRLGRNRHESEDPLPDEHVELLVDVLWHLRMTQPHIAMTAFWYEVNDTKAEILHSDIRLGDLPSWEALARFLMSESFVGAELGDLQMLNHPTLLERYFDAIDARVRADHPYGNKQKRLESDNAKRQARRAKNKKARKARKKNRKRR